MICLIFLLILNNLRSSYSSETHLDVYESFFDYASQRSHYVAEENREIFKLAISTCPYASVDYTNNEIKTNCTKQTFRLKNFKMNRAERIVLIDDFIVGVLSSSDMSIRFYKIDLTNLSAIELKKKRFPNQIPFDACVEQPNSLYVAFPLQHKIVKYNFNQNSNSFDNVTAVELKEETSLYDESIEPMSLACHSNLVYVSQKSQNQIRVYDRTLKLVRIIKLNGLIVSAQKALSVDHNVRVFVDGLDGVGLFNSAPRKRINSLIETSRANVCHFYGNINCIEDVDVFTEDKLKSSIYVVDSCDSEVKQFYYTREKKILLGKRFKIESEQVMSAVRNAFGYLFVLTNGPVQLHLVDVKNCE